MNFPGQRCRFTGEKGNGIRIAVLHIRHFLHHDRVLDLIFRISDGKLMLNLTVIPDIEFRNGP